MKMRLREEVAIIRFSQGAYPVDELLHQFSLLAEDEQWERLYELTNLTGVYGCEGADVDEAIANSGLDTNYTPCYIPQNAIHWLKSQSGSSEKDYTYLLHLVKLGYQRCFESKKGQTAAWPFTDLSQPETVQNLLTTHQELFEEIYTNPGFRMEFTSLAKLWHANRISTADANPAPDRNRFNFISYDELTATFVNSYRANYGTALLRESLLKALSKTYDLTADQANRLLWEVVERHISEMYAR